jgi:hypothetical protein
MKPPLNGMLPFLHPKDLADGDLRREYGFSIIETSSANHHKQGWIVGHPIDMNEK